MSSGGQRRSIRILELEAKKAQQGVNNKKRDMSSDSMSSDSSEGQSSRRQRRKKSEVNHVSSNKVTSPVAAVEVQSKTPLPQTSALELLLNMLKRRDTRKFFAEPVNAAEVRGYNNVIKDPMDFATISAKLSRGEYTWLEDFEHDVFLVFSNAMLFNGSYTIYYRQARAIREVAQKLFAALRADAAKFEIDLALVRIVGDGWTKAEARLVNSLASNQSQASVTDGNVLGSTGAMNSEGLLQQQKTHNPWTFYPGEYEAPISTAFSTPTVARVNNSLLNYGQNASQEHSSLNLTRGWGQVAQMVAQPEINKYDHGTFSHWHLPSPHQLRVPNPQQVPGTAYPGNGLIPALHANPFGNPATASVQDANARRDSPGFGNPPAPSGRNLPMFNGMNLDQLRVLNPQQVPGTTYPGSGLIPSVHANPFGNPATASVQDANARRDGPSFGNPTAPSGGNLPMNGMNLDEFLKYLVG
ncbi:bromodomain-containing protein DDB_G0280777-like isoform X2 [Punica granatum]|uniref:Uncharacterized protein n=2 Tax=Punica granatum TaxID=22663 RepID=A0A2I0KJT5_PUNGR|nr:bromodomain-containing protein DDB_G0280777-like isoform X2 [Punica granatum]PKI68772.1 hypothetical protein CRG98_010829 [Punica granatum]